MSDETILREVSDDDSLYSIDEEDEDTRDTIRSYIG